MKVLKKLQREKKIPLNKNKYECPVYLCETKHPSESALIEHYNAKHSDLVELGLKLRKSKALRK